MERILFAKQTVTLTYVTHVNGCVTAVYMGKGLTTWTCLSFFFIASLFRFFLVVYQCHRIAFDCFSFKHLHEIIVFNFDG